MECLISIAPEERRDLMHQLKDSVQQLPDDVSACKGDPECEKLVSMASIKSIVNHAKEFNPPHAAHLNEFEDILNSIILNDRDL